MKNRFDFKSAVAIIDRVDHEGNAIPFDVTFRTYQKFSKTGGKHLEYNQVKKLRSKKSTPSMASMLVALQSPTGVKRNPRHYENRTRNLELQNGETKKIHIRLITSINGKKTHY
ncbi:hypothetical protein FORMB_18890 [Formosa sp. Hel1_33_131]|uniref:hypothetical protein n=1 Tax=Formosa sp. Hel1_33_131 TaxID=1336794 RepID=UPI00084E3231|nr:hypothetical protein [Formosa sp. Hel1_33_131]AOR28919.1 hypothetical protein FORMB_18890 [Formosa sp. Hel1_33_131]